MTRAVSRRAVMTGPLASRLPRSTVAVLAGNAGTLVVGTATGVLAARALGPVARGEFVALQTWAGMLAMVFALGVSQTLVTDDGEDRALLGPLLTQTVASALLAAVLFTVVPMLITVGPGRSGGTGAGRGAAWDAVAVLGATCFTAAAVAASNAAGLAQRRGRMTGEFQLVRLLPAAATLAAFAALAGRGVRDPGLWMLTLGVTALLPPLGYHVAVLGGLPALARPGRLLPRRRFMRSALGAYGTVVGAQLIYKLDMLLVATFLAAEQVAFYAVAVAVAGACTTVCQATGMVMFSRLRTLVDPRQRARVVRRAVIATVALAAAVAGTIALVTPTAIRIVYGTRFAPAAPAAQVLVLATIPQSVDYLLTHVLLGFRAARTVLAIQVPVALSTVLGLAAALHDGRLPIVAAVSGITYTASAVSLHLASTRLLARAAGASPDSVPLDGASPDSERSLTAHGPIPFPRSPLSSGATMTTTPTVAPHDPTVARHDLSDTSVRYLDLLRATLTCSLWDGRDGGAWEPRTGAKRMLVRAFRSQGMEIVKRSAPGARTDGRDWPRLALTMTGDRRMRNLQECAERVIVDGVPGDFIETGVWRGGACILMRGVLAAYGVPDRTVWVADSFAGLPAPNPGRYAADTGDRHHEYAELSVSLEQVRDNFRRYGLLDDQVRFLRGWFRDTLPTAPIERLAVLRLDGDMYESTTDALTALYPKLSDGGFCIVDDYGAVPGCRAAVEDYRAAHGVTEPIIEVDWTCVYWRRSEPSRSR